MIVRVYHVAHRMFGDALHGALECASLALAAAAVDDGDAAIAHDEADVGNILGFEDDGIVTGTHIYARIDLLHCSGRLLRSGASRPREQRADAEERIAAAIHR